ncbi:MAG: NAD(P)H-dependent oxidoreductase [Pseudomonadota bacterium]
MHVLTIIDHPDPASFTHALAARFKHGAEASGHTVEFADLHAEEFNALWTRADVAYGDGGPLPEDVHAEQSRIGRADALCLVFPLFWYSMPAMMKGWIDKVWSYGWAYDQLENPDQSLQPARPTVMLVPAGSSSDEMDEDGITKAITLLWDQGTMGFFGMSPRRIEFLNGSEGSEERRNGLLDRAEAIGREIGRMK